MRIALPHHHLSIDASTEWIADAIDPSTVESFGLYVRSIEHGVYFNVRAHEARGPLTGDELRGLLREQGWASAPYDAWTLGAGPLTIVGGTFETVGMGGEVVLEVFVTDGRSVANLAGPGERAIIAAVTPSVQRLARSVRFA